MTFSEVVNYIQGDVKKGAELLVKMANEQEAALQRIKKAEEELQKANDNYSASMVSIENVCKHLKISPHFHIKKDKKYYHFTPEHHVHISNIDWEL
jgi:translation initiation factor IF-2